MYVLPVNRNHRLMKYVVCFDVSYTYTHLPPLPCLPHYPGNGYTAGLLYPFDPTALTPKITLSLLSGKVTLPTLPTSTICVHKLFATGRHTTSYEATSVWFDTIHLSLVSLSRTFVSTVTLRGNPGASDKDHSVARFYKLDEVAVDGSVLGA
jgi:hypothetical protein